MAGRQAEAKHELTALFSREIGQKDKAQLVRAMYIETTETKYLLLLVTFTNTLQERSRTNLQWPTTHRYCSSVMAK